MRRQFDCGNTEFVGKSGNDVARSSEAGEDRTNAVLSDVTIPFVTDNVRPVVLEVTAMSKAWPTKEPAGALPASGGELGKHESVVKVSWKVENPDADPLR